MSRIKELTENYGPVSLFHEISFGFGRGRDLVFYLDCSPEDGVKMKISNGGVETSEDHKILFEEVTSLHCLETMAAAIEHAIEFYRKAKRGS